MCCCIATGSAALTGHHEGEDREVFLSVAQQYPGLLEILRYLQRDHSMIAHLLARLHSAVERSASPGELQRHLEGVAAIME